MEFQLTTECDKETMLAFARTAGKTTRKWPMRIRRCIDFLFAMFLLIEAALLIWLGSDSPIIIVAIPMGLFFLFLGIFYYPLTAFQMRRLAMKGSSRKNILLTEEGIFSRTEIEEGKMVYSAFDQLFHYCHYYVLFVDKKHGVILDEKGIQQGNPTELSAFLERKCGKQIANLR